LWGGRGRRLFCGFKILAILQNLLPFCFVEFTLEKKKKKEKIYKKIQSFFYVTKRPKWLYFRVKIQLRPQKKKKKDIFLEVFFNFPVFWGYLAFPKNREISP
jgi:hypothetical protein